MRGTETIIVHRPSTDLDRFGDPVAVAAPRPIKRCIIVPRGIGGEENQSSNTVISGLQVFCPPGSDVKATDRVTARGLTYEVEGEPADYRTSSGVPRAVMVNLVRVTG